MSCYTRLPAVHHQSRSSSTLVTATSSPLASRLLASSRSLSISPSISQLVRKRQTRTVLSPNSAEKFLQIKAAAPAAEARAAAAHQTWISDSSQSFDSCCASINLFRIALHLSARLHGVHTAPAAFRSSTGARSSAYRPRLGGRRLVVLGKVDDFAPRQYREKIQRTR